MSRPAARLLKRPLLQYEHVTRHLVASGIEAVRTRRTADHECDRLLLAFNHEYHFKRPILYIELVLGLDRGFGRKEVKGAEVGQPGQESIDLVRIDLEIGGTFHDPVIGCG